MASLAALVPAAAYATPAAQPAADPLCLPPYFGSTADCQPLGSFAYLQHMAELGMHFPLRGVAAHTPDPSLTQLPYRYAIVSTMDSSGQVIQRPAFSTLNDAVAYTSPTSYIKPGSSPHYLTYTSIQQVDGASYYYTNFGWMRRGDVSPVEVRSFSMGLHFDATPQHPFGWVLEFAAGETAPFRPRTAPSLQAPRSSNQVAGYEVLEVFEIQQVGELYWYLVGPDMWLNSLQMRLVFPMAEPPEGVDNRRWIDINLEQQSIAVYENNQLVFATLVATGLDNLWTRPGLFQIYEKHESTPMSGDFSGGAGGYYYLADVPWTLYYDQARAIHGAYWRQKQFFGYQGSHGCVNLPIGDANWVFSWASVGDWVYVHDPSGRTPTDEEFAYGAGAP